MTDHEMRTDLARAQGWTDIQVSKISGQVWGIDPDGNAGTIPNPLESDRDAAACLRDRGGNCHEAKPPRAPYPMCAACTINTQAPARNPRHSRQDDRWQRFGT